jgi:hypothetical protein
LPFVLRGVFGNDRRVLPIGRAVRYVLCHRVDRGPVFLIADSQRPESSSRRCRQNGHPRAGLARELEIA